MFKGLSRWLFGSTERKVLLVGNDASGKTTLLYQLKLGEAVTTIPTIGFNLETVEYPKGWEWTFWDVGGCDKIYPLIRHYVSPDMLVVFLHDCNDSHRQEFPDWLHTVLYDMTQAKCKYMWVHFNKQDALAPENAPEVISSLRQMYEDELARYKDDVCYNILDHKLSAKTGEGVKEILLHLHKTLSDSELNSQRRPKSIGKPGEAMVSEEQLRSLIKKEASDDNLDMQSFWTSFLKADILAWDHRSHLKAGYIVVLECAAKNESIFTTADTFLMHLKMLKEAHPDRFRNTEHKTMTIFWLLQLQLAIWNYKIDKKLDQFPSWNEFQDVLLHTPSLRNTRLWSLYYTKDRLFSQQARESWTIPDLQQFPTLKPGPDSPQTLKDGQERLLRFAFTVAQLIMTSKLRRGGVIKEALASLQATTIRLRTKDASIPPYSETQAYFWIQIVHAALQSFENQGSLSLLDPEIKESLKVVPVDQLSFSNFSLFFDITPTTWKDYYTSKVWDSIGARIKFVAPDIKPLPNVIGISSDFHEKGTM